MGRTPRYGDYGAERMTSRTGVSTDVVGGGGYMRSTMKTCLQEDAGYILLFLRVVLELDHDYSIKPRSPAVQSMRRPAHGWPPGLLPS